MRLFHARDFFERDRAQWKCNEREKFLLQFDDGNRIETNTYRCEVSRKFWLAHENYDKLPILPSHHIGWGPLSNKRIQQVMSAIVEDVHDAYGEDNYNREKLWFIMYKTSERLYNESIIEYSEYVRSINSFHFSQLYLYPPLKAIRDAIKPNSKSIDAGYAAAEKILRNDPKIARNNIVSDLRSGLVKMEQLLQILIVRGYNTDIDSHIYNRPIMGNYHAGIHDPAEAMMESTLASKSIIFTGAPLEQTEYANRKMQFTSQQVDLLIMNDCGQRDLSPITITKGRFTDMEGLFFQDPNSGKLLALREGDTNLIGETLNFRLAFNCKYRHHDCICKTCYGLLAHNLPYGVNIGHVASTMTQSEVSQRVLKVKHSESSTSTETININEEERPFISQGELANQLQLNAELVPKGIKLLLRSNVSANVMNASKLPMLRRSDVRDGVSVAKHSQFRDVSFEIPSERRQPLRYHVSVSRGARMSYLTHEFLNFFLDGRFIIQADGYYHIDLDKWDFSKPVFELPNRHMNMKDYAAEVEVFIRSTRDNSQRHLGRLKQLKNYNDPVEALLDLHELISSKVPASFTHIATLMTSMMVPADDPHDFKIPEYGRPTRFAKYDHVISGRSLGALFAYQGGRGELEDMEQYMNTDRSPHLLDPVLLPL